MTVDLDVQQDREWSALYKEIREILSLHGQPDDEKQKDYLLVSDNLGLFRHWIETDKLEMVKPVIIEALQNLLTRYPDWEIVIAVDCPEKGWPPMGLMVRDDSIIDGLQREYLPTSFEISSTREAACPGGQPAIPNLSTRASS
jgi:hypothetical protein